MGIVLVGEDIDKRRAAYLRESGRLIAVARGIHVEPGDDPARLLPAHAVRLARYLYPDAYLSHASAWRLGPGADGTLFLAGNTRHQAVLPGLRLIKSVMPATPSLREVVVSDERGEMVMQASSWRQLLLEQFRRTSHPGRALSLPEWRAAFDRFVAEHGGEDAALAHLQQFAVRMGWQDAWQQAQTTLALMAQEPTLRPEPEALSVAWHGAPVARLAHDGSDWQYQPVSHWGMLMLAGRDLPGQIPGFLRALLPEGWLAEVLDCEQPGACLKSGGRFMGNINVAPASDHLALGVQDHLHGRLADCAPEGVYARPLGLPAYGHDFEQQLANIWHNNRLMPKMSGVQMKLPMHLAEDGALSIAQTASFTHLLKLPGRDGFEPLGVVEWLGQRLAAGAGLAVAPTALVAMPGAAPALLVERFDIRAADADPVVIQPVDGAALLGLHGEHKYKASIEQFGKTLRQISTDYPADCEVLLRQTTAAWLMGNGDMHLKNLLLLRSASSRQAASFETVRLSPVFDMLCTRVFPRLQQDDLALSVAGKRDHLRPKDLIALAASLGWCRQDARAVVLSAATGLAETAQTLQASLPDLIQAHPQSLAAAHRSLDLARQRADDLIAGLQIKAQASANPRP